MHSRHRTLGFLAAASAGALWGTGFFFGKIALREISVGNMVLYRFLIGSAAMLLFVPHERPRFNSREWTTLLLSALLGVPLQFLIQFHGLAQTTVAHAALMVGTMPVLLAAGAAVFLHERMDRTGWISLAGATLGACLISLSHSSSTEGSAHLRGDALVVLSLLISVFWVISNRQLLQKHSNLAVSSYGLLLGTAMLAAWTFARHGLPPVHGLSLKTWLALVASGVLCTVATTLLWNWGLTQVPASQAGIFLNMEPLMGSSLSVWFFRERLGWSAWAGGAMILISAVILTTRSQTDVRKTEDRLLAME